MDKSWIVANIIVIYLPYGCFFKGTLYKKSIFKKIKNNFKDVILVEVILVKNEIEARLLEIDVENFIKKLNDNDAVFVGDWLQVRYCYDFNPVRENSWIRLRTNGVETTLTIKEIKSSKIDGTKELEIVVSDFFSTDELLNKLGYIARSKQENRRIRYVLDGVEIDIDYWPLIPTYVEFEADSESKIVNVCNKLGIYYNELTSLDVESIYKTYGVDVNAIPILQLENHRKNVNK